MLVTFKQNRYLTIIFQSILFILLLVSNEFAQTSKKQLNEKIIQYYNSNDFKKCIDLGVQYLELYGSDSLKNCILKVKDGLRNFDLNSINQIEKNVEKVVGLSPKIIPLSAIYCGIGESIFGMMYNNDLPDSNKTEILNLSTSYFYKALDFITTNSFKAKAIVYQKMAYILRQYGDKGAADAADLLAFKYDQNNYEIGLKAASHYERIGRPDSAESILMKLYDSLKNKNIYQGVFDFLGDHFISNMAKIKYYSKAISYGVKDPSKLYCKIADEYFVSDLDSALKYYDKTVKLGLVNDKILTRLGLLYTLRMDCKTAINYFRKIKRWSDKPSLYVDSYAGCYASLGDYSKAVSLYSISRNHSQIAYCYLNLEYYAKTISNYLFDINKAKSKKWTKLSDKNDYLGWHYFNLAVAYAAINERANAFNAYENANAYMDKNDAIAMDLKFKVELYRILKNNLNWDYLSYDDQFLYLYQKSQIKKTGHLIQAWVKKVIFPYKNDLSTIKEIIKKDHPYKIKRYTDYYYSLSYIVY